MAGIDKIFGNRNQWLSLWDWAARVCPQYCQYFYIRFNLQEEDISVICNLPMHGEGFFYQHCPYDWVREDILERCGKDFIKYFDNINIIE